MPDRLWGSFATLAKEFGWRRPRRRGANSRPDLALCVILPEGQSDSKIWGVIYPACRVAESPRMGLVELWLSVSVRL